MKRFFSRKTTVLVVVSLCVILASSCVNNDYQLSEDNINTNVTIFQEGLTLPLGTTAPIKLSELYDKLDPEFKEMVQNKDGKYGFSYSGSVDLTDTLASFKEMLAIDALSMKESFSFSLSDVDLSSVSIDGQEIKVDGLDISDNLNMPDLNSSLPQLNQSLQGASIKLPELNAGQLKVDLAASIGNVHFNAPIISLGEDFEVPAIVKNRPEYNAEMRYEEIRNHAALKQLGLKLPELDSTYRFEDYTVNVPVSISLPAGIQSVEDIRLHKDARFEMILEMENPFFTSGSFTPRLLINLHDLFHVDKIMSGMADGGYMDHKDLEHHIHDNFVMNADNSWKADHIYHIESLAFNDWKKDEKTGNLKLEKNIEITLSGDISLEPEKLETTLALLNKYGSENKSMNINIDIKFFDFTVDDVVMNIAPISISENLEMPFNVSGIKLPDMVKKVDYVEFDENYPLTLNMSANIPEACRNMDMSVKTLSIEFPAGIEIDHDSADAGKYDPAKRTLTYKDIKLSEGLNEAVRIKKLSFADGSLNYTGAVKVTAEAVASGILSSKALLSQSGASVDMNVNVTYAPKLADYSVTTNDYVYAVKIDPVKFSEEIPAEVGKLEKVQIYLDDDPVIRINLDYPTAGGSLNIIPDRTEGLKIYFPQMLKFKSVPSAFTYDNATNSISFTKGQSLPKSLELPVDRLEIVPVYKEGEGYFIEGEMKVEGGVCLEGTVITKSVVDALQKEDASIAFSAVIPDLKPATLALDQYMATISESVDFEIPAIEGIPDMVDLKAIESFELQDVYLNFSVDASSIVKLIDGVQMSMDFDVKLPQIIRMGNAGPDNTIKVSGRLDKDNKLVIEPVQIIGLDLSGLDLSNGSIKLDKQTISVDGNVTLNNVSLDLADLKGADLNVSVEGSLATKDTELIKIAKVQAKVDCKFEFDESFDLSGLTEQIGDKLDFMLDFNRFHLDFDLKTNLSLPVQLSELRIIPFKGGVAGEPLQIEEPIALNTNTNGEIAHSKIRISNLESDKHEDPEYHHVVLDVLSLIKDMPDSIQLHLNAGTQDNASLAIAPSTDYVLAADYALELPLELGEDFLLEFADTLRGLPSVLGDVLALGSLGLSGEVTNSFPLALDLEFQLLDVDGNVIPMSEGAGHQTIKAGNLDGTPVKTELNIVLGVQKGIEIPQIDAVKLIFRATSSGAGMADDNFIQVQLNALIPEGVSVDLKELAGNKESTEGIQ